MRDRHFLRKNKGRVGRFAPYRRLNGGAFPSPQPYGKPVRHCACKQCLLPTEQQKLKRCAGRRYENKQGIGDYGLKLLHYQHTAHERGEKRDPREGKERREYTGESACDTSALPHRIQTPRNTGGCQHGEHDRAEKLPAVYHCAEQKAEYGERRHDRSPAVSASHQHTDDYCRAAEYGHAVDDPVKLNAEQDKKCPENQQQHRAVYAADSELSGDFRLLCKQGKERTDKTAHAAPSNPLSARI